jgi:hypothetical protein
MYTWDYYGAHLGPHAYNPTRAKEQAVLILRKSIPQKSTYSSCDDNSELKAFLRSCSQLDVNHNKTGSKPAGDVVLLP